MMETVEFRFPGGRWEKSNFNAADSIILFGDNYDLRINGEIRLAKP